MDVLGIDIGGSGIKAAPVDVTTGTLTAERVKVPTPRPAQPDPVAEAVKQLVADFGWSGPIGVTFPERLAKKAIASIIRQQKPDFSYAYGEYLRMMPMHPINRPGGSLGRSQACNLALRMYGLTTVAALLLWAMSLIPERSAATECRQVGEPQTPDTRIPKSHAA